MERVIKEHTFFDDLFNNELIVVDLGACKGEFIEEFAENYNVKKAILVEANPSNYSQLNVKDNYVLYNKIISNEDKLVVKFYEDKNSPYNGSTVFNYFNGVEHDIETITLESIMLENSLDYIDLLKIDIEGSEYDLLLNLSDNILNKIKQISVEFHDFVDSSLKQKTLEVINKLELLGFKRISKPIHYMNNSENYDVLFYKK